MTPGNHPRDVLDDESVPVTGEALTLAFARSL
jgi:hypothetical protein